MKKGALITIILAAAFIAAGAVAADFSWQHYAKALSFVNDKGMVDYKAMKAGRSDLDAFAKELAGLDREVYEKWIDKEKIAFWISAYNGLMLKTVIGHYPIEASFTRSLLYPDNSVRQISGVFDGIEHKVMGADMTLDQIEHGTLRAKFKEPRIHMALVCAAMGCPPLRNEPYTGEKLDAQLDDQTTTFLKNPEKFRIDRKEGVVWLSSIFKWFGDDFTEDYHLPAGEVEFMGHSEKERAVLNFISGYLDKSDRKYLEEEDYKIEYLDYDWTLNEQQGGP